MGRSLKIGVLQFSSSTNKIANLEKVFSLTKKVEADVVVLPEYSMFTIGDQSPEEVYSNSEDLSGPLISKFKRFARDVSAHVIATLFERATYPKVYNTAVVLSPKEDIMVAYRKLHLFDALGYRESDYVVPGDSPSEIFDIKGSKAAIAVCFDIRFPELFRYYAILGAEVVFVPSAWYSGPLKEEILEVLSRSRAIENTYYVVIANQTGSRFTGGSMIVDPLGVVVLNLGLGEKYVEYEIYTDYVHEVRRSMPVLNLRREDIYSLKLSNRSSQG